MSNRNGSGRGSGQQQNSQTATSGAKHLTISKFTGGPENIFNYFKQIDANALSTQIKGISKIISAPEAHEITNNQLADLDTDIDPNHEGIMTEQYLAIASPEEPDDASDAQAIEKNELDELNKRLYQVVAAAQAPSSEDADDASMLYGLITDADMFECGGRYTTLRAIALAQYAHTTTGKANLDKIKNKIVPHKDYIDDLICFSKDLDKRRTGERVTTFFNRVNATAYQYNKALTGDTTALN